MDAEGGVTITDQLENLARNLKAAQRPLSQITIGDRPSHLRLDFWKEPDMTTKSADTDFANRVRDKIADVEEAARAALDAGVGQEIAAALADCRRALKRAAKRAEALSGEWERVEFVQTRGPIVEFTGRLLLEHSHDSRRGFRVESEVWETEAGAFVAVLSSSPLDGEGFEDMRVSVIEPSDDVQAMRFAALDHFGWDQGMRRAATKAGWSLRMEVA